MKKLFHSELIQFEELTVWGSNERWSPACEGTDSRLNDSCWSIEVRNLAVNQWFIEESRSESVKNAMFHVEHPCPGCLDV